MKEPQLIAVLQRTASRPVLFFCLLLISLGFGRTSLFGADLSREPQLKAVYIYNFTQFTDWPAEAFPTTNSPIVIGVLDSDLMTSLVQETVQGETVRGRKLVVQQYKTVRDIKPCHLLFIPQGASPSLEKAIAAVRGKATLTVSDAERAAQRGVMIRLYPEANKLRLQVNLNSLNAASLKVSSKLLRVAEILPGEGHP